MKKANNIIWLLIFLFLLSLLAGCRRKERPYWHVNALSPLIRSSLNIGNITGDSLVQVNPDSTISIIFQQDLFNFSVDSLVSLPVLRQRTFISIDSIELDDNSFDFKYTLLQILRDGGFGSTDILLVKASHGSNSIVPIPDIKIKPDTGQLNIDISAFLKSATFTSGWLDLSIENQFPIDIENVIFELKNKNLGTVILRDTFPVIPARSKLTKSTSLAGKTIEGDLQLNFLDSILILGGNTKPPIDTNEALVANLTIRDISVEEATAVFPAQNLVEDNNDVDIPMDNGAELKTVTLRSGNLRVDVISTAQDTIYFDYLFSGATKNGIPFKGDTKVPPALPGQSVTISENYDLTGYTLDLTGSAKDSFNRLASSITARIDSTGNLVSISQQDSFKLELVFENIFPEFAEGYFGSDTILIGPDTSSFKLFNRFRSGTIDLEAVDIALNLENSMGAEGSIDINSLTATNTNTGNSETLTGNAIASPFSIQKATRNPYTPTFNNYILDNNNSNITDLIQIMPDQLGYTVTLIVNPNGNNGSHSDFAFGSSEINAGLDIEVPLSFIANDLVLRDTLDLDFSSISNREALIDGELSLIAQNGFPISTGVTLLLLDENGDTTPILSNNNVISAADLPQTGKVVTPKKTTLKFSIDVPTTQKLLNAAGIIIETTFNTLPQNEYIKIYDDYSIDFKLVGDFNYSTSASR